MAHGKKKSKDGGIKKRRECEKELSNKFSKHLGHDVLITSEGNLLVPACLSVFLAGWLSVSATTVLEPSSFCPPLFVEPPSLSLSFLSRQPVNPANHAPGIVLYSARRGDFCFTF